MFWPYIWRVFLITSRFKKLPHVAPEPSSIQAVLQAHPDLPIFSWPQSSTSTSSGHIANITRDVQPTALNDWVVTTGDTQSKFRFSLFACESSSLLQSQASAKQDQSGATGGQTATKQDQSSATGGPTATKQDQSATGKPQGKASKGQSDTSSDWHKQLHHSRSENICTNHSASH